MGLIPRPRLGGDSMSCRECAATGRGHRGVVTQHTLMPSHWAMRAPPKQRMSAKRALAADLVC